MAKSHRLKQPTPPAQPEAHEGSASAPRNTIAPVLASAIELVPVESLRAYAKTLKIHDDRQIGALATSIREFGFNNPIIIDPSNVVVVGHARLLAAKMLGMNVVPVIRASHLTPERVRAYRIADNRLAELGRFDPSVLQEELRELSKMNLDFELETIGFNTPELDVMLGHDSDLSSDPDDTVPQPPRVAVTRPGDLFVLGRHRLLCGDALVPASWSALVGAHQARMVFTDPPYNLDVRSFSGLGKTKHPNFLAGSGELDETGFIQFLGSAFARLAEVCVDGALWYVWMDFRHMHELMSAARANGLKLFNLGVWDKQSGGMGSYLRSQHELCFIWKQGSAPHINNVMLGKHGRNRSNVWSHPGLSSFGRGRDKDLVDHPTVKPLHLAMEGIRDCTDRGDLVLDAFLGSGTTILAAERTGRVCFGTELDPVYCDVIIRRWQERVGGPVVHQASGLSFEELAEQRADEAQRASEPELAEA